MKPTQKYQVTLQGIRPIMFDRFMSMKETEIAPERKFYYNGNDQELVLPSVNIHSFLSADLTESATKRVAGRSWKKVARAALSYVDIDPISIPFLRDGKPLTLDNSGWYVDERVARVKKGGGLIVPSSKVRPVIPLAWGLTFDLTLFPNTELNEEMLKRIFEEGGLSVGLGTFRGVFGKFVVDKWEKK